MDIEKINLNTKISKINRLSKEHASALSRLKLETVRDLLFYLPVRFADERENRNISNIKKGEKITLFGELRSLKIKRSFVGHIPMCEGKLVDATGSIKLVWFHQAYIAKMYPEGEFVKVSGVVGEKSGTFSILNPTIEKASRDHVFFENSLFENIKDEKSKTELIPIYRETKSLSSNFINILLRKILKEKHILKELEEADPLPKQLLSNFHLPSLDKALLYLHFPKGKNLKVVKDQILIAKKRMSFEEIFYIQVLKETERKKAKDLLAFNIKNDTKILKDLLRNIEGKNKIKLTNSQTEAISSILDNLKTNEPMGRLLEGDVGSGKTLVAQVISYIVSHNINRDPLTHKRLQIAYMAPTEILASQHFESYKKFFMGSGVEMALFTGKICKKFPSKANIEKDIAISKSQVKKWIENGDISIVIGTHSLINDGLIFQNLALAIIDEQHRFGVKQRAKLANKNSSIKKILPANDLYNLKNKKEKIIIKKEQIPHLLSMTATPIPRTLALTIFGDLDLTVIDEMPKNRKKIETKIVEEKDREDIYREIGEEIKRGYQAYIVTPRIDELDEEAKMEKGKLNLRSVTSEVKSISKYFNEKNNFNFKVAGLHSKLKKEEKEKIMQDFLNKKIDILVATSVVEVGVNVPNASRMIIEGAERFGLAQLHQLRGRIGRGERESVCYLFTSSKNDTSAKRLSSLVQAKNGFELAELDLEERGIGSLLQGKQWGVSDLAMEAIKNLKLVEAAKEEARKLIYEDPSLDKNPNLKEIISQKEKAHME